MAIDESVYLLDKNFHFSVRLKSIITILSRTRSITASYSEPGFPGIPSISSSTLEYRSTEPYSKRGLLKIFIFPEDSTEKPNAIVMQITSDNEINQSIFDSIAEQLERMYGEKHPVHTIMESEDTLFAQLMTELKSRGDYEIDIPKFVDVLFKLGVVKSKEENED